MNTGFIISANIFHLMSCNKISECEIVQTITFESRLTDINFKQTTNISLLLSFDRCKNAYGNVT